MTNAIVALNSYRAVFGYISWSCLNAKAAFSPLLVILAVWARKLSF